RPRIPTTLASASLSCSASRGKSDQRAVIKRSDRLARAPAGILPCPCYTLTIAAPLGPTRGETGNRLDFWRSRMLKSSLTRRAVLKAAALTPPALAASSLAAPFVRGAYAAGKLSFGTWDHWVPGASQALEKICQ